MSGHLLQTLRAIQALSGSGSDKIREPSLPATSAKSEIGARKRSDAHRIATGRAEPFCSDVEPEVARNEEYDDHDADDVKNIHCLLRIEPSVISI
jgi:hypothetical protein